MPGRKPKPPLLMDNNVQKLSKLVLDQRTESWNKLEVEKTLKCPGKLSKPAKKEWKRVMRLYDQMKVSILSDLDQRALIVYCEAVAAYDAAQHAYKEIIENSPEKIAGDSATVLLDMMDRQSKLIAKQSEQLCLTPVGRARMGIQLHKVEKEDGISELLRRKREASQ